MGMARMQAVTFAAFGAPHVLKVRELERPEPGPGDVLVRVHAACLDTRLPARLLQSEMTPQWGVSASGW